MSDKYVYYHQDFNLSLIAYISLLWCKELYIAIHYGSISIFQWLKNLTCKTVFPSLKKSWYTELKTTMLPCCLLTLEADSQPFWSNPTSLKPVCGFSFVGLTGMLHSVLLSSVLTELLFMGDLRRERSFTLWPWNTNMWPQQTSSSFYWHHAVYVWHTLCSVVVVEKSWCVCVCWPGTSVFVCVCVCQRGKGKMAGRSIVVPMLFWPQGRKLWKWGVERRRKKCHSDTVGVKGISD